MQERTWNEYNDWLSSNNLEVEEQVKSAYEKAKSQLDKLVPLEDTLLIAVSAEDKALVYRTYLDTEKNDFKDPIRIQALYERIVGDIPLYDAFWTAYCKYVDRELKAADTTMIIYQRATRNCPWRGSIWADYIYAAERYKKEAAFISSKSTLVVNSWLFTSFPSFIRFGRESFQRRPRQCSWL